MRYAGSLTMAQVQSRTQHPLDNLLWDALTGPQAEFSEGGDTARRYQPAVAPFAAVQSIDPASLQCAAALVKGSEPIAFFTTEEVAAPPGLEVVRRALVNQMVLADIAACTGDVATPIQALGTSDVPDMLALAALTEPGPFAPRTIELGAYRGIRAGCALVAMAGERVRVPGFSEISAVCVDPAWRGRGYAADLMRGLAASMLERHETPFLHVFPDNESAIALYRKLGFALRRQMHLSVFARHQAEISVHSTTEDT